MTEFDEMGANSQVVEWMRRWSGYTEMSSVEIEYTQIKYFVEGARYQFEKDRAEIERLNDSLNSLTKALDSYSKEDGTGLVQKMSAEIERLKKALEEINSLGEYCCDLESLGHECKPVLIAREALNG